VKLIFEQLLPVIRGMLFPKKEWMIWLEIDWLIDWSMIQIVYCKKINFDSLADNKNAKQTEVKFLRWYNK
jgi:hypothetical protein